MASCLIFLPHYAFLLLPHDALLLPFYLIFLPHYAFLLHHASLNTNSVSFNTCATPTPTLLVNYLRLLLHCISHFLLHYISFTTPRVFDYTIPRLLHHASFTTPRLLTRQRRSSPAGVGAGRWAVQLDFRYLAQYGPQYLGQVFLVAVYLKNIIYIFGQGDI